MTKVSDYINQCLAYEQYAFTWDELKPSRAPRETKRVRTSSGRTLASTLPNQLKNTKTIPICIIFN